MNVRKYKVNKKQDTKDCMLYNFIYVKFLEKRKCNTTHTHVTIAWGYYREQWLTTLGMKKFGVDGYILKLIFGEECMTIQVYIYSSHWHLQLTWVNFMAWKAYSIKVSKEKETFNKVRIWYLMEVCVQRYYVQPYRRKN